MLDVSDDSWLQDFKIPKQFSPKTMECVSTGILTQSSRTEIVQTLATLMWLQTHYPSREAYTTVCARLVKVHPTLADDAGDGQATYVCISILCKIIYIPFYSFPGNRSCGIASSFWDAPLHAMEFPLKQLSVVDVNRRMKTQPWQKMSMTSMCRRCPVKWWRRRKIVKSCVIWWQTPFIPANDGSRMTSL